MQKQPTGLRNWPVSGKLRTTPFRRKRAIGVNSSCTSQTLAESHFETPERQCAETTAITGPGADLGGLLPEAAGFGCFQETTGRVLTIGSIPGKVAFDSAQQSWEYEFCNDHRVFSGAGYLPV